MHFPLKADIAGFGADVVDIGILLFGIIGDFRTLILEESPSSNPHFYRDCHR